MCVCVMHRFVMTRVNDNRRMIFGQTVPLTLSVSPGVSVSSGNKCSLCDSAGQ